MNMFADISHIIDYQEATLEGTLWILDACLELRANSRTLPELNSIKEKETWLSVL
jgi:hypothetical protein